MRLCLFLLCLVPCLAGRFVSIPLQKAHGFPVARFKWKVAHDPGGVWHQAPWFGETRLERLPALSYTTIYIGTPPRKFKVQVDTGSADVVIPGAICESCMDDVRFFVNRSSTSRVPQNCRQHSERYGPCPFSIQYGDGTKVKGVLIRDRLALDLNGGPALGSMVFLDLMLVAEPEGVFASMGINGIFGMGFDTITANQMTGALSSIMQEQGLDDVFAMYVGSEIGANDGVLTIGGIDRQRFRGRMQFTPIIERSYYCVAATGLAIGQKVVIRDPRDFGMAFVDSGTTFTLLPEATFRTIQTFLQHNYCHLPLVCAPKDKPGVTMFNSYCLVAKALPKGYPVFTWHFHGGVTVLVPPEAYFRKIPYEDSSMFCFGIGPIKTNPPYTILGDTFMVAAYVVFDRQQMRIGFGQPTNSPFTSSLPPPGGGFQIPTVPLLSMLALLTFSAALCCCAERRTIFYSPEAANLRPAMPLTQYGAT